jgi:hypothetical protein
MFKFEKRWTGSISLIINDSIDIFAGTTDHWGLGFDLNFYDRSFTLDIIHWYVGVAIWHRNPKEYQNEEN